MLPDNRKLNDYLPDFLRPHFESLLESEEPEFELAWAKLFDVLENAFLDSAKEEGISRYESLLRITPLASDNLENRRFVVLTRIGSNQIVTLQTIKEELAALVGEQGYQLTVDSSSYVMTVRLELGVKRHFDVVKAGFKAKCPANLIINVTLLYNTHSDLSSYTHAQLSAYTHHGLREEVFNG